ncbi:MAG: GNAT family N-acetyltransferase [Gammaproteobacteria bacterium]
MSLFFETSRLIINIPQSHDIDDLYSLQSDPDVMKYIGHGKPRSKSEVTEGLNKAIEHYQKHGFSVGCVFEKTTGEFVGRAGLIYLAYDDTQSDIEIGYALHKKYWGKGYATELAKACVQWGFQHINTTKLVGVTLPHHIKSQQVLEKAGMKYVKMNLYRGLEVTQYEIQP